MTEQENATLVKRSYELFKTGDIESLLDLYSNDISGHLPEMKNVPRGGKRKGKISVREFFSMSGDEKELLSFEPIVFAAKGDKVVVLGNYSWRVKTSGKEYASDWAHVVTVKDGKIIGFKEFMDAADAAFLPAAQTAEI